MRALIPHLSEPVAQICVSDLASDIKDHDADVGAEVVRWVQFIERFLTGCVPNVYYTMKQSSESEIHKVLNGLAT